jgi:hypothetical protein|tara:strand:- start:590 stop:790 length:201 start_codon:yes stop_codon:yes gene_type:complete
MFTYPYITLIASYLLVGVVVGFLLELAIRKFNFEIDNSERLVMIGLWPFMAVVFVYNFLKGYFKKD